jgi:hypothetical protein
MQMLHQQSGRTAQPVHRYALPDFGLTGSQVDERFAGYHGEPRARWH